MAQVSDFCTLFLRNLHSKCPAFTILSLLMVLIMQITCFVPQDLHAGFACPKECSCASPESLTCWATPSMLPSVVNNLTVHAAAQLPLQNATQLHTLRWLDSSLNELPGGLFEHCARLTTLVLSSDALTAVHGRAFTGLANLQNLDLSNNNLTDLPQDVFAGLLSLMSLSLRDNQFESLPFQLFADMKPNLTVLDLSHNHLVTIAGEFFQPAPHLHTILLSDNRLTKLPVNALSNLPRLRTLDLSRNRLVDLPRQLFNKLNTLAYLNLSQNKLKRLYPNLLKDLRNLHTLNLSHNPIQNLTERQFDACSNLRHLVIEHTNIRALNQFHFEGLKQLRTLTLSSNPQLAHLSRFVFQAMPRLENLSLARTNLTTLPDTLSTFTNLTLLDITENPLVCGCTLLWLNTYLSVRRPLGIETAQCHHEGIDTYTNLLRTLRSLNCRAPLLAYSSETRTHRLGSAALLECNFHGSPPPSVAWLTPNLHVYHFNPDPSIPDIFSSHPMAHDQFLKKIDMDRHELLDNGTLRISDVQRSDAGAYICLGSNPLANVTQTVYLYIDPIIVHDIKINGLLFGVLAAVIFLTLTLLYQLLYALLRR